jgi:hypothetical protein
VALGDTALASGSLSGADNTAIGDQALYSNTTGAQVTGVGALSLANNTTGFGNSGLGYASLVSNTTGNYNTALGRSAFNSNTTASNNTAVGYGAGYSNTTGYSNTALGTSALYANTTGANIVAVGHAALDANTTGNNNTGVGKNALGANTTGEHNSGVGLSALESNTTGINNTAIGRSAGASVTGSSYNTFVGHYAGQSTAPSGTGGENTFIGQGSGYLVTTGTQNTILGRYNGNQGNLDIRTTSNNIVLADGDGNVSLRVNGGNNPASKFYSPVSTPLYGVGNARVNIMSRSGNLIQFLDGSSVVQGSITISGTTVSYNGGHLARWSRLLDNSKDTSIVKGTVMTNLDEMVEWGDEDNEQLNKMAVSSVEGDPNVAGVFVNWDTSEENSDDNIPDWNDMNVAMTGDMVIRIAQGTTVARGDLLMSAGDGTAKPQGDDIVRSKTIAKVTSTNVSHTYDDGSYLVPCVLMAC